jgi:hypothetical protein
VAVSPMKDARRHRDRRRERERETYGKGKSKREKEGGDESTSDLRHRLDSLDGVLLDELDEQRDTLLGDFEVLLVERLGRRVLILFIGSERHLLRLALELVLNVERLLRELLGVLDRVTNVNVVEEDVLRHRPDLEADAADGRETLGDILVLEEVRVGNLARRPDTQVGRVGDLGGRPDAFVGGVGDGGPGFGLSVSESAREEEQERQERTATRVRIRGHPRTWGSRRQAQSNHRPPRRPTPRASQRQGPG